MPAYVPPSLLAPLPAPGHDPLVGGLVAGVSSFLSSANPILGQAAAIYGALESKKANEQAAKRQHQLDLAAVNAQGAQGKAWLTPTVAIAGAAVLGVLVLLVARR